MNLSLVTAPAEEPVSLVAAKEWLRVTHDDEDVLIAALITNARDYLEGATGRQFVTAQWRLYLDGFPRNRAAIEIPKAPLVSVESVNYVDSAGNDAVWGAGSYRVIAPAGTYAQPGRIALRAGSHYPSDVAKEPGAVWVDFTAGYGSAEDVPDAVNGMIQVLVADMYANREAHATGTTVVRNPVVESMIARLRVPVYA